MGSQQFCLKWKSHYSNLLSALDQLVFSEALTDVTVACEGLSLKAHRVVLAACSPFFQSLFVENQCQHPIVILKDFKFSELRAIVDFMYHGEVNVSREHLSSLLKAAEALQVKGLTDLTSDTPELADQMPSLTTSEVHPAEAESAPSASCGAKRLLKSAATSKRKRVRPQHVTPRQQESQASSNEEPDGENSTEGEGSLPPSAHAGSVVHSPPERARPPRKAASSSVLEALLSMKELKCSGQASEAPSSEPEFEPSRLLEQALAGGDNGPDSSFPDGDCHQKLFPASSQLSLLATAKMLESQSGAGGASLLPEAEGDASAVLATLATSGESSCSGSGSSQSAQSLFPARGGRNSGWTEDQMQKALSAVFAEGIPMTTAARRFGIPKTTLLYRLQNSLKGPKT